MIVVPMMVILGFYASVPVKGAGPAAVVLGGAGNYVILAETGISTATATTHVTGNIAVSPIDSTAITGFALSVDSSGVFATSTLVTGQVFAANYASPTPATLTTAVANMMTAYTDAAGRTADVTEFMAGDLTSQTLTPQVYKWSTGVSIGAAGCTISGASTDYWIFQVAQTLNVANGASVTLSGGALASHIVWQVAGDVTIGTTASMKGTILCQTAIHMNTDSILEGRALAQTAVTLDSSTVYTPDTAIPEFSTVMIPLIGIVSVIAIAGLARNQKK